MEIRFDDRGLVPVVIQDWATGEVLTLAYMNREALERTRATGELHLYSRSRDELWHKGATSGNTQAVRALRVDCDADAILALVEPAGPAFLLESAEQGQRVGRWSFIGEKVMEEAEEVSRAAREETDDRVDEEAADVLYHLTVLLRSRGRDLADAEEVLLGRRR